MSIRRTANPMITIQVSASMQSVFRSWEDLGLRFRMSVTKHTVCRNHNCGP
jgi:hypothetical protein